MVDRLLCMLLRTIYIVMAIDGWIWSLGKKKEGEEVSERRNELVHWRKMKITSCGLLRGNELV